MRVGCGARRFQQCGGWSWQPGKGGALWEASTAHRRLGPENTARLGKGGCCRIARPRIEHALHPAYWLLAASDGRSGGPMLRIMWCKRRWLRTRNANSRAPAQFRVRRCSTAVSDLYAFDRLTGVLAWQADALNDVKSCSPSKMLAACRIASPSSGLCTQPTRPDSTLGRTGDCSST